MYDILRLNITIIIHYLMNTITAVKTVKMSGSSKAIYITSELNLLGDIQVGDKIEITLKKID